MGCFGAVLVVFFPFFGFKLAVGAGTNFGGSGLMKGFGVSDTFLKEGDVD